MEKTGWVFVQIGTLDIFERHGLDLTDEQKDKMIQIAEAAYIGSGGRFGLAELLYFITQTPGIYGIPISPGGRHENHEHHAT